MGELLSTTISYTLSYFLTFFTLFPSLLIIGLIFIFFSSSGIVRDTLFSLINGAWMGNDFLFLTILFLRSWVGTLFSLSTWFLSLFRPRQLGFFNNSKFPYPVWLLGSFDLDRLLDLSLFFVFYMGENIEVKPCDGVFGLDAFLRFTSLTLLIGEVN